ncbi:MAG: hypothetical protein IPK26_14945 [Planctomycetes bacterium]|nr:hypothetical protein [Planctomycetota bacterium]
MLRNFFLTMAGFVLATAAATAQRASVVSVDTEHHCIVVKLGEAEYKLDATKVTLLDREGKVAKLADFAAKDKVMATMTDGQITSIQKLASDLRVTASPTDGKVVKIIVAKDQIVVRCGESEHTAEASKVKLLDSKGNPTPLATFAAGDRVSVTLSDGVVTVIQRIDPMLSL